MKKYLGITVLTVLLTVGFATQGYTLDYSMTFVGTEFDQEASDADLGGKDNWWHWTYKVEVIDGDKNNGLSHFTLELADCFSPELLAVIQGTMGEDVDLGGDDGFGNDDDGGHLLQWIHVVGVDNGGTPSLYGLKWELDQGDFEEVGDVVYFWFSAPTDQGVLTNDLLVKHGQNNTVTHGIFTPDCPQCDPPNPSVPEPTSLLLLGSGLVGMLARKKRA